MDSPGKLDTVFDDGDFLLQLAQECAEERLAYPSSTQIRDASQPVGVVRQKASVPQPSVQPQVQPRQYTAAPAAQGFYVEPQSGLKVSRPVIGSLIVRERLSARAFVKLGTVKQAVLSPGTDWATVAVIASKSINDTRNGGTFSRWQLSDLDGGSLTLFLFGQAHQGLYKEPEGSVIMIYNAKLNKDKDKGGPGVTLAVDKPDQVTRIGHSPDFAFCKGTKRDGGACRNIVNRSRCEYCPYHAAAALKQLQSQRPDLRGRSLLEQQLRPVAAQAEANRRTASQPPQAQLSGRQLSAAASTIRAAAGLPAVSHLTGKRSRGLDAVLSIAKADEEEQETRDGSKRPKVAQVPRASRGAGRPAPEGEMDLDVELSDDDGDDGTGAGRSSSVISAAKARLMAVVAAQRSSSQQQPAEQGPAAGSQATRSQPTSAPAAARTGSAATGHAGQGTGAGVSPPARASPASSLELDADGLEGDEGGVGQEEPRLAGAHTSGQPAAAAAATRPRSDQRPAQTGSQSVAKEGPVSGAPGPLSATQRHQQQQQQLIRGLQSSSSRHNTASNPQTAARSKLMKGLGLAAGPLSAGAGGQQAAARPGGGAGAAGGRQQGSGMQALGRPGAVSAASRGAPVSAMAAAFGSVVQQLQDENEEPMVSRYHELGQAAAWDTALQGITVLEKKDELAQQLDSVMSLKVSAFQCHTCGVCTEHKRKECGEHRVTKVQTTKRFWQCCHCNGRFDTVGVIFPKRRCPRCNDPGMDFKPVPMYRGPRGSSKPAREGTGLACRENMLARGTEHSFSMK